MNTAERALLVNCDSCWQVPGVPCTARGSHLGRYQRAERKGLITRVELLAAVRAVAVSDVIAGLAVVPPQMAHEVAA